MSTPEYLPPEI